MKVFNIDEYLNARGITIQVGKKEFLVKDIPFEVHEKLQEEKSQKEALKMLLNCDDADLEGYGIAAVGVIIRKITENLFREPSQEKASKS